MRRNPLFLSTHTLSECLLTFVSKLDSLGAHDARDISAETPSRCTYPTSPFPSSLSSLLKTSFAVVHGQRKSYQSIQISARENIQGPSYLSYPCPASSSTLETYLPFLFRSSSFRCLSLTKETDSLTCLAARARSCSPKMFEDLTGKVFTEQART